MVLAVSNVLLIILGSHKFIGEKKVLTRMVRCAALKELASLHVTRHGAALDGDVHVGIPALATVMLDQNRVTLPKGLGRVVF